MGGKSWLGRYFTDYTLIRFVLFFNNGLFNLLDRYYWISTYKYTPIVSLLRDPHTVYSIYTIYYWSIIVYIFTNKEKPKKEQTPLTPHRMYVGNYLSIQESRKKGKRKVLCISYTLYDICRTLFQVARYCLRNNISL